MKINCKNVVFVCLAVITVVIWSCSDDDFRMNSSFINSETYAEYTDQTPIQLSTFRLDSVLTSGQNKVWVGKFTKPVIGDVYSESYVKMSQPSSYGWAVKEKYDSITMVLRHTGDWEGDTMKAFEVDIHRLAQPIRFTENENSFYNVRSFRDSISIGSFRFVPRPHTRPRIRFRLNDDFGRELVQFIKDSKATSEDQLARKFENMLGGIKIVANGDPKSMLGFLADSVKIVLHSHINQMDVYEIERTLSITEPEKQFNHVWNENMDSPYDNITERYHQVTELEGGLHSVMFEGLGYYTRVNFPSWETIQQRKYDSHLVKATLKIFPERGSYDRRDFPSTFTLAEINRGNVLQTAVTDSRGQRVVGVLVNNILDEDQAYYTADLTYYINKQIAKGDDIDLKDGVVLLWGENMSPTNYEFMLFNGHNKKKYRTILELYYYNYDKEER